MRWLQIHSYHGQSICQTRETRRDKGERQEGDNQNYQDIQSTGIEMRIGRNIEKQYKEAACVISFA
jgi:hypothetical protein